VSALLLITALAALAAASASASISDSEELTRFGSKGSGAGQLSWPAGIATDPTTGHVFTVEIVNNRISEFTPWGSFVKAFGWDVAPGAVNEQQEVRVRAASGQFKLSFKGEETTDLAFNAPGSVSEGPGSVEAALNALASIGGAGANVSVSAVPGTPDGKTPFIYVIAFKGSLAGKDVEQITIANGATAPSGGVPSTTLEARTRADGTPGGTGLESCTEESGCKAGLSGGGAGELGAADGVAVDSAGHLYVKEFGNLRVQKFDSVGRFLLMFGGEVDKTTTANRCTALSGDECGVGTPGTGSGQFSEGFFRGIALGSGGELFATDKERIQRFNSEGEFEAELPEPGKKVSRVAFDPVSGDLYAIFEPESDVRKLDVSTGKEVGKVEVEGAEVIATDSAGNLFAAGQVGGNGNEGVLEFDSGGKPLSPSSCCEGAPSRIDGLATNAAGDLYATYFEPNSGDSFIRSFGPGPTMFEAAPKVPPSIAAQFAGSVGRDDATVAADINPHFWSDARYYVQYGAGKCSEGGCEETRPLPPGAILSSKVTDAPLQTAGVSLEGLKPGTTYHYRFVAQSTGGGPVYGIDPDGEGPEEASAADGKEGAFTTYPVPAPPKADCPNQPFRTGFSAPLPDCRAFEMVSPVDKNNGDIKTVPDLPGFSTSLSQSAVGGERFTYSSYRGFADPQAAPYTSQYLASRDPEAGWSSEALDPAQDSRFNSESLEAHYKAFSADLCLGWVVAAAEPVLAAGASKGYRELYRRGNCGGGYEALLPAQPTTQKGAFFPVLEGTTADGGAAIAMAEDRLTEDAPVICVTNYKAKTETVSYQWLRDGAPIPAATSPGYVPGAADEGTAIQCQVTAKNKKGPLGSTQAANPPVAALLDPAATPPVAPPAIAAPTASGPLNVGGGGGQTLSCDPDEAGWQNSPTFSYQWYRNGAAIGGASASTYVLTASDLTTAAAFQCAVTGTNADDSVVKMSANRNTVPPSKEEPPTANASMPIAWQTYYASKGQLHFLCILPSGLPSGGNCSGGTEPEVGLVAAVDLERLGSLDNAISADGSRAYWTDSGAKPSGTGTVYLRENPGEEQSALSGGACTEPEKACTVKVSETQTTIPARFWGATPDGAKALFEVEDPGPPPLSAKNRNLYLYDAAAETSSLVAAKVIGVAATSEDLARIYFISEEALGAGASVGKPNLYLREEEEGGGASLTFIATLSKADVAGKAPSDATSEAIFHAARATSDGKVLTFLSTERLSGYDNTDLSSGKADSEVYIYEAGAPGPICVSCDPSGARPAGRLVEANGHSANLATASSLAMPTYQLHSPRVLSEDGRRLFFNSFDALLPRDTNGKEDVYEWESSASQAGCEEKGAELYVASAEGCLSLISTGESPLDSELLDAGATGGDAFFTTVTSLLPRDPGLIDVYDARVLGGIPEPTPPPAPCQGEACQPAVTAPNDPTPSSSAYKGPGNLEEKPKKHHKARHKKKRTHRAKRGGGR
jgi:hypothetical protein